MWMKCWRPPRPYEVAPPAPGAPPLLMARRASPPEHRFLAEPHLGRLSPRQTAFLFAQSLRSPRQTAFLFAQSLRSPRQTALLLARSCRPSQQTASLLAHRGRSPRQALHLIDLGPSPVRPTGYSSCCRHVRRRQARILRIVLCLTAAPCSCHAFFTTGSPS